MLKEFKLNDIKSNPTKLVSALRDSGFAILTEHGIQEHVFQDFYNKWHNFFSGPQKFDYTFNKENQSGYFPYKTEKAKDQTEPDLKEFYHFYADRSVDPTDGATTELQGLLHRLGLYVLHVIEEGLPEFVKDSLSERLTSMALNSNESLFRIINYPPTGPENFVRANAHEDINLITLLPGATSNGLQVLSKTNQWVEVGNDPDAIVLNVGDMLEKATKGFLKSTTHRVVNTNGGEARISAPYFIHPRPDVMLTQTLTAKEFLDERLKAIGLKN